MLDLSCSFQKVASTAYFLQKEWPLRGALSRWVSIDLLSGPSVASFERKLHLYGLLIGAVTLATHSLRFAVILQVAKILDLTQPISLPSSLKPAHQKAAFLIFIAFL